MFSFSKLCHNVLRMMRAPHSPSNLSGFFVFSVEIQGLSRMRTTQAFLFAVIGGQNSGYEGAIFRREIGASPFCEVVSCSTRQSVGVLGLDTSSYVVLHGFVIVLKFLFPTGARNIQVLVQHWCVRVLSDTLDQRMVVTPLMWL